MAIKITGQTVLQYDGAGYSSTNIAVGYQALLTNTTGVNNTAVGYQALNKNQVGVENSALGYQALYNTTGSYNTGIGTYALYNSTGGLYNTAVGHSAMNNNSTGGYNTAVGYSALAANASAYYNTGIGYAALSSATAGYNTAVGASALLNNTTGTFNAALGYGALSYVSVGYNNVGIGYQSGAWITSGANNVVIGGYTGLSAPISSTGNNYVILSDGQGNIRQVIDPSGNVGISTTSPNANLHVVGTAIITSNLTVSTFNVVSTMGSSYNAANVAIANVNYVNTAMQAAFAKANTAGASGGYYKGNNGDVNPAGYGDIFRVHSNTMSANIYISSGNNSLAAGPVTVSTGYILQINTGARVVIV